MTTDARQQLIHYLKKQLAASPYMGLYHLMDWGIHLDTWPELRDDVEAHKSKYIKSMLTAFIEDNYGHVESTLNRLQAIGIKWPELEVIEKSYDLMTQSWPDDDELMEATDARYEYIHGLADLASNSMWLDFLQQLSSEYRDPNDLPDNLKERLHGQFRRMFLTDFEADAGRYLAQKLASRFELLPYLAISTKDVALIVDKHKDGILRHILKNIKITTSLRYWAAVVYCLKEMGVAWPELDLIYRSILSDYRQINEEDTKNDKIKDIIVDYIDVPWLMVKKFSERRATVSNGLVANAMTHVKPHLIKTLIEMLKDDDYQSIPYNVELIKSVGINWPELDTILKSAKFENDRHSRDWYLGEVNIKVNRQRSLTVEDYSTIRKISSMLHNDNVVDALWVSFELPSLIDPLKVLFDQNKDKIIRGLLLYIKQESSVSMLDIIFDGLARQAIQWPELEIAKRSVYSRDYKEV